MIPTENPTFDKCAAQIAKNGFSVLPIRRNEKRPAVAQWERYEYCALDPQQHLGAGVGILTKRTPVIDVDVRDELCAAELDKLVLTNIGPAPKRIGQAPKAAYVCQLAGEPFPKIQTRGYRFPGDAADAKAHKVEILADGQQLVIYNIHPETHRPYTWNGHGSPLTVPVDSLPPLSMELARDFIAQAETILAKYGKPIATLMLADSMREHTPSEHLKASDPNQLRQALAYIRNDDREYDDWIHIGHALKGALGDAGRDAFLAWSAQSTKNDPMESLRKWETFKPEKIGAGTIYYLAERAGWKRERVVHELPPVESYEDLVQSVAHASNHLPQHDAGPGAWMPPPVTTYGATFNPASIPLRQWAIRGRYAVGEGTVICGPPGTNKSTMLLTDAVQLVTGRSLLGDRIEKTGGVLFLVGEDRRRDFEARLAGICAHYNVASSELRDRLHVVFQSEINSAEYTLGSMARDIATLNTHMFEWLRQRPNLVAIFIDPMISWHRLIENDNACMQALCIALRGLAAQGNVAVAFDHHVTKAAMFDVEAHVGNLASMRGGSTIAGDMRWAFTLARIKPETAAQYGIPEDDRKVYRRFDTLKASYGADDDVPRMLKIESVRIANGEEVGVLTAIDIERLRVAGQARKETVKRERAEMLADALGRMLMERSPRSCTQASLWIAAREPSLFLDNRGNPQSDRTIRRKLEPAIGTGIDWKRAGGSMRIVLVSKGKGNGARHDIEFEQRA